MVSLCQRGFWPGDVVRLRVYCGGNQQNVIAVNNEVVDAVNCRGVTQRLSRCGRRVRRDVIFKFHPLFALCCSRLDDVVLRGGNPLTLPWNLIIGFPTVDRVCPLNLFDGN